MVRPEEGLSAAQKLRFVLGNELLWMLGEQAPAKQLGTPGASRHYPEWVWYLFDASISIYLSARKVTAELAWDWDVVVAASKARYPDSPEMWAPPKPPKRHHWQYAKKRLRGEKALTDALHLFEQVSAAQGLEMGICDPRTSGSISHPTRVGALIGDGKVITPLYKAKRDTPVVDKETGEILGYKRADPTALPHVTGGGKPVYGNKYVFVAGRTEAWHGRMIFAIAHVPTKSGEAQVALECIDRIAPNIPGATSLIWDGAFRGVHHRHLLRTVGLLTISPPAAAKAATEETERQEKTAFIENKTIGSQVVALYAVGGQIGIRDLDAEGSEIFTPLQRLATKKVTNRDGTYRFYGAYQLPNHLGGRTILVRADTTEQDIARGVNRSENFRLVPPGDPDYEELYSLRSDIEANNRQLEDSLWINRAHSDGAQAQLLDLLGYSLLYNSVGIGLARQRAQAPPGLAAAA